jgi:hypothetical protein
MCSLAMEKQLQLCTSGLLFPFPEELWGISLEQAGLCLKCQAMGRAGQLLLVILSLVSLLRVQSQTLAWQSVKRAGRHLPQAGCS